MTSAAAFTVPEIETERLRLRLPAARDLKAYAAFRGSRRSETVGGPFSPAQAFQSLAEIIGQWQLRGYGRWLVADKTTDDPLGIVGIYHPQDWPEAEIGWSVFEAAEGRGIAHEAALASRRYAYETLGWTRIVSLITDDNTRSQALAKRMGATPEDIFVHPTYGNLRVWCHALHDPSGVQSVYSLCTPGAVPERSLQ